MSFVAHIAGGVTNIAGTGYCNLQEATFNGASFTLTSYALTTKPIGAVVRDSDSNFYVAFATTGTINKYTSSLALITTWANGGTATTFASSMLSVTGKPLAVDGTQRLFVGSGFITNITPTLYAYTSAGVSLWTNTWGGVTLGYSPITVVPLPNGNWVSGARGTQGVSVSVFYEYARDTGLIAYTYSGLTAAVANWASGQALCVTSSGVLIYGGSGTTAILGLYVVGTSTPVWTKAFYSTLNCSFGGPGGYVYTLGSTSLSRGYIGKINIATGVVTASVINTVSGGTCFYRGCVASDGSIVALSSAGNIWVYSANLSAIANTVGAMDGFITPYDISGGPFVNYSVQSPVDVTYSKRLVAFANDQVWAETTTATMAEITAARATISTGSLLIAAEAFQKCFVANGSNKRILDFANTKLWTSTIGTNIPTNGTILTGGTTSAQMVCDFLTNSSNSCEVYGFKTTAANFSSGETVTNAALSVTFVLGGAQASAPSTYAWTPYANDTTTYGTMPAKSTLVCRYRGRIVLSGNSQYPHQWYMSRTANPWDWKYQANDPLAPVAGQNSDAGQLGDIIVALIPYGDDYLIFGCAGSIHVLKGDPCSGGSIDELDKTTGIFGPKAWCRDADGNTYFLGNFGIYKIPVGLGGVENISSGTIPKLVDDWNLDPALHRVVLTYDSVRLGIVIAKTELATGLTDAYFYSLQTQGFYPEDYPASCGIYSAFIYNSTNADYRKNIVGCADGYLRIFDDTYSYDEGDGTIAAITAYAGWVQKLAQDDNYDAKVLNWTVETAGGISVVALASSDTMNLLVYTGDDAESVVEKMAYNTAAFVTMTFSGTGLQPRQRLEVRTRYVGLKCFGAVTGLNWAVNRILGEVEQTNQP